ncbi:MAG TPA: ABC transporter ATP-binding protein [Patescibacteria group bacterium]|jgi:ABC-2 type transport system ATP-binding protein|nr:ABC transporter ATP-binding protein [Patescibacteria group bacterium]
MTQAIEVNDLSKTFVKRRSLRDIITHPWRKPERITALDSVSFSVAPGEIFGLLGPNGAGKTTLLKILSCLIIQSRGTALINGFSTLREEMRVKSSVGFVTSDERSFYWRLSGRENLRFFASLYNLPPSRARRRCQEVLDRLELTEKADAAFMTYSSGMKQRMAVARALLHDPPVLFMDEPSRSLDPLAAKHLRTLVADSLCRQEGKTILLATHNLAEAEELCSRIAIIHKSRIRRMGTLAEARSWALARERYVIEVSRVDGALASHEFPGGRVRAETQTGVPVTRLHAELDPGGEALTHLLGGLVARGAVIVSCTRVEASLQEIFDMTVEGSAA